MRPITDTMPKPLVKVAGPHLARPRAGHASLPPASRRRSSTCTISPSRSSPMSPRAGRRRSSISDESAGLLDSAGGIVKALPQLGREPFYILNADTFWIDGWRSEPNLARLALAWDAAEMDILLMLADLDSATGHTGGTDFLVGADGALARSQRRSGRADLCGRGDRQSRHLCRRAGRTAVAQPLFRRGDRRAAGCSACRCDGQLDHGRHARRHSARRGCGRAGPGRSAMSGGAPARLLHPARRGVSSDACRRAAVGPAGARISATTAIR